MGLLCSFINPLNTELNPICYLLALLGAHHFLHISRIRVKSLTLRLLMSYIYIYMDHPFLIFLDHTQQRTTVGRTPLDEWSARPEESYQLWCVVCDLETSRTGVPYIYDNSSLRVNGFSTNECIQYVVPVVRYKPIIPFILKCKWNQLNLLLKFGK